MRFSRRVNDDSGAALIVVLILITVISLGVAALLTMSDTSLRTTIALRGEASDSYAVDAAANAALNELRGGTFNGVANGCTSTTGTSEALNSFIPANGHLPVTSVGVRCTADSANAAGSGGGANSSPGSAILTLGTAASGETGIYVNTSNNTSVKVNGGIFSNSNVLLAGNKSDLENTNTNSYVYVDGTCTSSGTSKIIATPAATCNYSSNPNSAIDRRGMDPGTITGHGLSFDAPAAPTVNGSVAPAACSGQKVYEFQPGLYTSAATLNNLTNAAGSCSGSVWHFNPGKYYFNFTDAAIAHKWTVSSGYLVGGTATASPFNVTKVAAQASATPAQPFCVAPSVGGTTLNGGVEFVFGGDSRMDVTKGSASANPLVNICASNSASGPPIAIYGLKTSIGSGAFTVPAQSGCITKSGYTAGGDVSPAAIAHCPVVQTYNDPNPGITIYGTSYTPSAVIDLYLNNNTVQVFRWGLVVRSLFVGATGSASLANAVIDVPSDAPLPFALPSVQYLDVYVCPGATTCSTSGTVGLRVKVVVSPTSPRTVNVLSWNYQR